MIIFFLIFKNPKGSILTFLLFLFLNSCSSKSANSFSEADQSAAIDGNSFTEETSSNVIENVPDSDNKVVEFNHDSEDLAEEEIVAVPPVIISGSFLACQEKMPSSNDFTCSFKQEESVQDFSEHTVNFFAQSSDAVRKIKLKHALNEDKTYGISITEEMNLEANMDIIAEIEIEGKKYSVDDKDEALKKKIPPLPQLKTCEEAKNDPKNQIIVVRSADDLVSNVSSQSFIIIEMSGNKELEVTLDNPDGLKGLCTKLTGESQVSVNIKTRIQQIAHFATGSSQTSYSFGSTGSFGSMDVTINGGAKIGITGNNIDCDEIKATINGEKGQACISSQEAPEQTIDQ